MTDPRTLIPVVMGVGLAAVTTRGASRRSTSDRKPTWHEPLFILATQLVGFAVVGAALFIAGWSVEKGQQLGPRDLKAENLFIVALGAMIAIVAVRNALVGFVDASTSNPWERGLLDRASTLLLMVIAVLIAVLLGMGLDALLIGASTMRVGAALPLVTLLLVFALTGTVLLLRYMLGEASTVDFAMTRRQQQRTWTALEGADGAWVSISIKPVSPSRPDQEFKATVWRIARGWCFRADDAYALARYHGWVGDHLEVPVEAFHLHRVSVFAGAKPRVMRGMRITATTRRLWWIDAWRSHKEVPPVVDVDEDSPERKAGLLLIDLNDLRRAGLLVIAQRPIG